MLKFDGDSGTKSCTDTGKHTSLVKGNNSLHWWRLVAEKGLILIDGSQVV